MKQKTREELQKQLATTEEKLNAAVSDEKNMRQEFTNILRGLQVKSYTAWEIQIAGRPPEMIPRSPLSWGEVFADIGKLIAIRDSYWNDRDIARLREQIGGLEAENQRLKSWLDKDEPNRPMRA